MNKSETKLLRTEARALKTKLTARQKAAARAIAKHRAAIRSTERQITTIERDLATFARTTTDRLAILEGRLNS